jgi:hypothetical protein
MNQLDQATQGNAASAEETAATSEELDAQAHGLNRDVTDLIQLVVGGSQGAAGSEGSSAPHAAPSRRSPSAPEPASSQAHTKVSSVRPLSKAASVIPFDDDEMPRARVGNLDDF